MQVAAFIRIINLRTPSPRIWRISPTAPLPMLHLLREASSSAPSRLWATPPTSTNAIFARCESWAGRLEQSVARVVSMSGRAPLRSGAGVDWCMAREKHRAIALPRIPSQSAHAASWPARRDSRLAANDVVCERCAGDLRVAALVRAAGGRSWRLPGSFGRTAFGAGLDPLGRCAATPFQRDLSPPMPNVWRRRSMKLRRFSTADRGSREDGKLWTPNGRHRLAAGKVLA